MSKVVFKHLIFLLFINFSNTQENRHSSIFIGHAFGSHNIKDQMIDPSLDKLLKDNYLNDFNSLIFGGDFLYDCNDKFELSNFFNSISNYNYKLVIGNHDNCDNIKKLVSKKFESENYYEIIGENLLFYLNTNLKSENHANNLFKFIGQKIDLYKPKSVLIFSHQLIFSKSDFYVRVNSRSFYKNANLLYDLIFDRYFKSDHTFYFISGDIGAYPLTPYAFYDFNKNFNFYAVGLGNQSYNKGIIIDIKQKVDIKFIDLDTYKIEKTYNYYKIFIQVYQLPKLILSRLKKILSRV